MPIEETSDDLSVSDGARTERLTRRVAALERQVEVRIDQVEDLQRRLAHAENLVRAGEQQGMAAKAAEYDALMNTFTMKALRMPRSWYGEARRRLAGRSVR